MNKWRSTLLAASCALSMVPLVSFASPINAAYSGNGGVATQSSDWAVNFALASAANDGNTQGDYYSGSVSHTNSEFQAWWKVTFNGDYTINSIKVFNRTDCCGDRINPFSVILYDAVGNVVWSSSGNTIDVANSSMAAISVPNIVAHALRVQLDGTNYLQLAEVEAWGDRAPTGVPEPSSLLLMLGGLAGIVVRSRTRRT